MRSKERRFLVLGGFLFCLALIPQPVLALCGNCGVYADVLACYASSQSDNYCFTVRCNVAGNFRGTMEQTYCCFDDMACSV